MEEGLHKQGRHRCQWLAAEPTRCKISHGNGPSVDQGLQARQHGKPRMWCNRSFRQRV